MSMVQMTHIPGICIVVWEGLRLESSAFALCLNLSASLFPSCPDCYFAAARCISHQAISDEMPSWSNSMQHAPSLVHLDEHHRIPLFRR